MNPLALAVMSEVGIDVSTGRPREVASLFRENFRYAVAMCDEPRERYPVYPFTRNLLKWSMSDPEIATGRPEERKQVFRQVRDQIRSRVEELIETTNHTDSGSARAHAAAA